MSSTRANRSSSMSRPSVTAAAVKLWPVPAAFTVMPCAAACLTTAAISSSSTGRWMATGAAVWLPAQLRHSVIGRAYRAQERASGAGLERLDELRQHLVDVAHDAEVGDREDRRFLVL